MSFRSKLYMSLMIVVAGLAACSDRSNSRFENVNATYTAIDPAIQATNVANGQSMSLEVFDVVGAVVELE
jgi:hypothetical protein